MILIGSQLVQVASGGHKTLFQWEWTDLDSKYMLRYVTREHTQEFACAFLHVAGVVLCLCHQVTCVLMRF